MPPPERELVRLRGRAVCQPVRRGTGSEHTAIVLLTAEGEHLTLVRLGGNPFADDDTRALAGKQIEVEGYRVGTELRWISVRDVARA